MATEAVRRKYLFTRGIVFMPQPTFFHNVLHDMESVVWSIFSNLAHAKMEEKSAKTMRNTIIDRLFTGNIRLAGDRQLFIATLEFFDDYVALLGDKHGNLLRTLSTVITTLVEYYQGSEAGITAGKPIDLTKFRGIHKAFRAIWAECKAILKDSPIALTWEDTPLAEPTSKRKQIDDEPIPNVSGSKRPRR